MRDRHGSLWTDRQTRTLQTTIIIPGIMHYFAMQLPTCAPAIPPSIRVLQETEQTAGGFMEQAGQNIAKGKEKIADAFGAGKEKAQETAVGGAHEKAFGWAGDFGEGAHEAAAGVRGKAPEAGRTATDTAEGATQRKSIG